MSLLSIINSIRTKLIDNSPSNKGLVSPTKPTVCIGDVYSVNNYTNIQYPLYVISQGEHQFDTEHNYVYYNLTVFYIEEIGELGIDSDVTFTKGNWGIKEVPISTQSEAILNFFTVIKQMEEEGYLISNSNDIKITPFTQKFNDVCCGVYIQLTVREELTKCNLWFGQDADEEENGATVTINAIGEDTDEESDLDAL